MPEETPGLPVRSKRDPRHPDHAPPKTPRCPPGECVAPAFVALCPKCDWPVNVPRAGAYVPRIDTRTGEVVATEFVPEEWRLRAEGSQHG